MERRAFLQSITGTEAFAKGLSCYQSARFFDAHEHWESVWVGLCGPQKNLLQALIQIAVALHHFYAGNRTGATSLLRRVLQQLEAFPACFSGIAVAQLRYDVAEWVAALEDGAECADRTPPRIQLV
jgi:predicted metal-dependent hydrolase